MQELPTPPLAGPSPLEASPPLDAATAVVSAF